MEIKRDVYLQNLVNRMQNGMVKVVTGVRRCGKSYLLFHLFKDYLLQHDVDESHITALELDIRENRKYRDPDVILAYIKSRITDQGLYYVFLDEVQLLADFEEVLNSLLHLQHVDVYVTGSNSRFLSRDVITEFRGRGDEVRIHPLTFKEYMQVYDGDMYHGWADYVRYGGMPFTLSMPTQEQKVRYLENLFTETYLKDIVDRYHVEKAQELDDLVNVLASSVGSLANPRKLEATFKSVSNSSISQNTIRQYIEYLKDAFLINEVHRYDVKGRKYIGSPLKYYFEDAGLRNARLGFRQVEENHLMENIIFNELVSRGYQVDVGVVPVRESREGTSQRNQLEIDFVANMGSKRYYLQSAYRMAGDAKEAQEKASFLHVDDSFRKILIVKDVMRVSHDEKGITTLGLYDFLLHEDSLDA